MVLSMPTPLKACLNNWGGLYWGSMVKVILSPNLKFQINWPLASLCCGLRRANMYAYRYVKRIKLSGHWTTHTDPILSWGGKWEFSSLRLWLESHTYPQNNTKFYFLTTSIFRFLPLRYHLRNYSRVPKLPTILKENLLRDTNVGGCDKVRNHLWQLFSCALFTTKITLKNYMGS